MTLAKASFVAVAHTCAPDLGRQALAMISADILLGESFRSLSDAQLERVQARPPADLVITLRTLLI